MRRVVKLILLVFLIGQLSACDDFGLNRPHPSDASLLTNFEANEAAFDQLARMCQEDASVVRIADNFTWTTKSAGWPRPQEELGFSVERWNEYRELFKKIGLDNGLSNYQPDLIHMFASNRGLVTGGSSKGYAYSTKTPAVIADTLDDYKFQSADKRWVVYRRIKDNWYLYYEVSS